MDAMIARRILLVAACIPGLLISARALDVTPFPSFAYDGQQIRQAVIAGVDTNGVTLIGKDAKGEELSLVIPLLATQKMVLLNNKAKDEIEATLQQQRSIEVDKRIAEYRRKNAGREMAFDLNEKVPQGWLGFLCVRPDNWMRGQKDEWNSGTQVVLVRYYGKAAAEGERIITRAEEKGVADVDVAGHASDLRVYEVAGDDRSADAPAWQPSTD